jgi:pimeloyl-ACP methyl ester carboxylesterase
VSFPPQRHTPPILSYIRTGSNACAGIEVGAERVAREIEDALEELGRDGHKITRFSIIGYSLGGLVARYAVGLLYHKGFFDRIAPINFTTFASPHLGVRTPLTGYQNHLWNVLGARTLSTSGRQLFTIDNFRNTNRPLLSVLADPDSIFIHALARFRNRSLYANIINDRTALVHPIFNSLLLSSSRL